MFQSDDGPIRVSLSTAARDRLTALGAGHGERTVLLGDSEARLLPEGEGAPAGAIRLGWLGGADDVSFVADAGSRRRWWRSRAVLDLTDSADRFGLQLADLSEQELFAALSCGPLPQA